MQLFFVLLNIRDILETGTQFLYPHFGYHFYVLMILSGSYIFTVRQRFLRLSLFLFSCLTITFLYFAYIISSTKMFFCVIIIILLSQSVFGMYREKQSNLATNNDPNQ